MSRLKSLKLEYRYIGNENPEKNKDSESRINKAFDILFDEVIKNRQKPYVVKETNTRI